MTDVRRKHRWMPVVLALSLAVNLAVVAAVAGAVWRHKGAEPRAARGGAVYFQALPREMRRALRQQVRGQLPARMETGDMLTVLRAEPFDTAAAMRVLEADRAAGLARQDAASAAWLELVGKMTVQQRGAYADTLQALLDRPRPHKRP